MRTALRGSVLSALLGLVAVATIAVAGSPAGAASVTSTVRSFPIDVYSATLQLEYCGNGDVTVPNERITQVVLVVHGDSRTACNQSTDIQKAALAAGTLDTTLVVAPHFFADKDGSAIPPATLYWSDSGWKSGDASKSAPYARPWAMSSFEAMDRLVRAVSDPRVFPGLARLTIAGHSAGGQFTNRYAAFTRVSPAQYPGVDRRYVVANPSSYVYLTSERLTPTGWRGVTSAEAKRCSSYDRYKYGMQRRNAYAGAVYATAAIAQYGASRVTYLVGAIDTSTTDSSLDTSCAANWQGPQRRARAEAYFGHLGRVLGNGVYTRHTFALVPDVGHTARGMFTSPQGVQALFS